MRLIDDVVSKLANGETLPEKNKIFILLTCGNPHVYHYLRKRLRGINLALKSMIADSVGYKMRNMINIITPLYNFFR